MLTLEFSETNNGVGQLVLVGTLPGGPLDWPVPLPMSGEGNQGMRVCILMATVAGQAFTLVKLYTHTLLL